jgi:hypothetical protein
MLLFFIFKECPGSAPSDQNIFIFLNYCFLSYIKFIYNSNRV